MQLDNNEWTAYCWRVRHYTHPNRW